MRRFLDWTAAQSSSSGSPRTSSFGVEQHQQSQPMSLNYQKSHTSGISSRDLEVQYLMKLLHEIKYHQASASPLPSAVNSQNQKEFIDKINRTLPLFLNVFGSSSIQSLIASTSSSNSPNLTERTVCNSSTLSASQSSLSTEEFRDLSQSESCPSSKPTSPLPPRSPLLDKFPDILPYAFTIARHFVSEVRQRASDKHAEDASLAILQFLRQPISNLNQTRTNTDKSNELIDEKKTPTQASKLIEDGTQGWNLLLSLNTLANSQNPQIIQLLCDASLPSTLIKCLYLFYDLPVSIKCKDTDAAESGNEGSSTVVYSTRDLATVPLVKAFTQLLVQLCSYQSAIDELIRKDDLRLVLGIASSQCSSHNKSWRRAAFKAILAISKSMRNNFAYLEQNLCIQVYIDNLNRTNSLASAALEDIIETIGVLIEFVYNLDVNNRNQTRCLTPIIEQLKTSRIMELIEELLFKIDESICNETLQFQSDTAEQDSSECSVSQPLSISSKIEVRADDFRKYGKCLIQSLIPMSKILYSLDAISKNTALKPLASNRFEMLEQFRMPKPTARDCILNNDILRLFKLSWSKCKDYSLLESVLDATISLFNDDKYNYFVFESEQLLVYYMSSPNFNRFPFKLKQKLFKFLEFIVIETNYIPCLELGTLGAILTSKTSSNFDRILVLRTIIACLRFSSRLSDIFRDIGILEVITNSLNDLLQDNNLAHTAENLEVLYLLLESSQYLLSGINNRNCIQFNESGAARNVFNCLSKPKFFSLFVPTHSSSSDDGYNQNSRNSTPTPTCVGKAAHQQRYLLPLIQANHNLLDLNFNRNQTQSKPSIKQMQKVAFTIIRQLILSNVGDEHLANLLGLLARTIDDLRVIESANSSHSSSDENTKSDNIDMSSLISQEVNLKIYILKSLIIILRDSHRCRALFRKVGGFVYVVSALTTLEKALPLHDQTNESDIECHNRWKSVDNRRIWRLIKNIFSTIVVAMRSEPANVRVFCDDTLEKFVQAIKSLGCFNTNSDGIMKEQGKMSVQSRNLNSYRSIFLSPPSRDLSTMSNENIRPSEACCQILRFLYDMALDMVDGTSELEEQLNEDTDRVFTNNSNIQGNIDSKSLSFDQSSNESAIYKRRSQLQKVAARPPSLDLKTRNPDPAILTFPGVVMSMLNLVPSCPDRELLLFACLVLKSLFRHERNQQLLCEAGMIGRLLDSEWRFTLIDRTHSLHSHTEYMLESLSKQAISPRELRMFLRLDEPLCCSNLDSFDTEPSEPKKSIVLEKQQHDEIILSSRIETLVNMMSNERTRMQPPFVEFDMYGSGSSFLFMPSIAPVNTKLLSQNLSHFLNSTLDVHTTEKNGILGGVGSYERAFPPATGLTFSTWICIEQFPARSADPSHNIRLLTIYRGSASSGKEYSCLKIQISALDRALTVSTQESLLFDNETRTDTQSDPESFVRVWTPETLFEGRWHHIAISLNKTSAQSKQRGVHIYIDGHLIHSQRISYISSQVGPSDSGPLGADSSLDSCSPAAFVNAFIGSLPQIRLQTKTLWKQGPCHLIEESLSSIFISAIYLLGPSHIGNFQSMMKLGDDSKQKFCTKFSLHESNQSQDFQTLSASTVSQPSPRHGYPLTRVSSTGMQAAGSMQIYRQQSYKPASTSAQTNQQLHINEDRIMVGLDARSTSFMSLARMRKIYTRFDCRQVIRFLGLSSQDNSMPLLLLHNTAVHLNGSSRGVGALTIGHDHVRCFIPSPTELTLSYVGGSYVLIGLLAQAQTRTALSVSIRTLVHALISNPKLQAQMEMINGFQILTVMLSKKKHLIDESILEYLFALVRGDAKLCSKSENRFGQSRAIKQVTALRELVCESFDLWLQIGLIDPVLEFIHGLISSSPEDHQASGENTPNTRARNLKYMRDMDLLPRMLRLLPRDSTQTCINDELSNNTQEQDSGLNATSQNCDPFDAKAVYLIKQTVFELLNRTPRQSDILYFGQYLVSLLPSGSCERTEQTINLRNVLLKSLLQMMTRNKQPEMNKAMQEEFVRILGFDWFMLFISGAHLDNESITLGLLNLLIILSSDEIYINFKNKLSTNGEWLKEPTFPTIDGKFNVQLLGINMGLFFGLSGKGRAISQDVLEASNYLLLKSCLTNLRNIPHIYLMILQAIMGRFRQLDAAVLDSIGAFNKLNLDSLCDCLIGETHHKRRQALAGIEFRCLELAVCLIYMIGDIMRDPNEIEQTIPTELIKFFMYLYNNNHEFQDYCRKSEDLIEALCDSLLMPVAVGEQNQPARPEGSQNETDRESVRRMCQHQATKEVFELSRLIILDRMTIESSDFGTYEQLKTFDRFTRSLACCKEAQCELIEMLLRQILLIIDSTSRHSSIKTIGNSDCMRQLRLLLINSILVSQIVADKLWYDEIFSDNINQVSSVLDHQLCLAEQIFRFNEILPKNNPPYAFTMQHTLNRVILYAISRPMTHISDKLFLLELLKKIHDNRTIIILNHMHSPHSAEFFVCLTYCLMNIIEENNITPSKGRFGSNHNMSIATDQPASLIERQYGHPSGPGSFSHRASFESCQPNSTALVLVSLARKVWDAIYQSKRGILAEAFDVPLSLPAFTLETSLDLVQLKPDINDCCTKYWSAMLANERKPKQRLQPKHSELASHGSSSTAVNILSGKLTRVVNAASFVSRVVGATAGSMASNVNIVGERLTQTTRTVAKPQRSPSDLAAGYRSSATSSDSNSGPTSMIAQQTQQQTHSHQFNLQSQHSVQPASNLSSSSIQLDCFKHDKLSKKQILRALRNHISIIDEHVRNQLSQKNHKLALHKYLCDEWLDLEFEILLRERALFGPNHGSKLDKWCLDLTEGPRRMRKKMVNNTRHFYENYPYCPKQYNPSNKSLRYRPPMSFDSHMYYLKTLGLHRRLFVEYDQVNDSSSAKLKPDDNKTQDDASKGVFEHGASVEYQKQEESISTTKKNKKKLHEFHSSSLESISSALRFQSNSPRLSDEAANFDQDDGDSTSFVDFSPEIEAETNSARDPESIDSLSVLRLLEKNERISHMFRCSRVQGLDTYEGLLLFGREHFYLIDGFTLLKTREIKDIDSLPPDAHDPIIPNSTPNILAHSKKTCAKFAFDNVVEVHKRRYLLQPIALEIFSSDGRNTLIVFPRNIRNKVHSRLMAVATQITSNAQESLAGQKSNVSVEGGSGLLSNLMGETSVTQRWVRGELSNFQYLMNLNTIAGRSYNDLMQYPIFPWVLADYTSDHLDFNNPATFRDLSRPIGAQTSERLDQFKRRYSEWDDSETPPYHYGTFYSSAMIVASYMVRMEPFTQHFLRLQGGHFDLADRMFHSINDSWLSASKHNMADIRELIPEFFYLPEFLTNENKYDLGIKQNGMRLDDVVLPPWAKDDPREFIRLHRCALESDYVSLHLHEWIDLIFGYKQQGQPAVDSVNVFHHLFYEGNVDIYNTDIDPIKKNAVIGFINNFGQVPKQLFKRAHPARKITNISANLSSDAGTAAAAAAAPSKPILPSLTASSASNSNQRVMTHCLHLLRQTNTSFKELRGPVGQIVQVDSKNVVSVEQNKLLVPPEFCRYVAWGYADRSLRMGLYESEKPIFVWEGSDNLSPYEILCCAIPNNRLMITAGTDSFISVWRIERMRSFTPVTNLYGHIEPVTCLAASQAYSLIVSGSRDRTAIVWDLNRLTFIRQLGADPSGPMHRGPISAISINDSTGDIATCSASWLYLWTINGNPLAQVDTFSVLIQQPLFDSSAPMSGASGNLSQLHILSVCFSQYNDWDLDEVIITGSSDGSVAFWSMRYFQSPMSEREIEDAAKKEANRYVVLNDSSENVGLCERHHDLANKTAHSELTTESAAQQDLQAEVDLEQSSILRSATTAASSDPIDITRKPRQRTDTMNSEWVKLSTSSASTLDTMPFLRTTPSSPNEFQLSGSIASAESITTEFQLESKMAQSGLTSSAEAKSVSRDLSGLSQASGERQASPPPSNNEQSFKSSPRSSQEVFGNSCVDTDIVNILDPNHTTSIPEKAAEPIAGKASSSYLNPSDSSPIKFSKSDNSLVESFVLLGSDSSSPRQHTINRLMTPDRSVPIRPQSSSDHTSYSKDTATTTQRRDIRDKNRALSSLKLQPNHRWRRELYLRGILPRQRGKSFPSAVTCLTISKDHKNLYVGDASGRISCWSIG